MANAMRLGLLITVAALLLEAPALGVEDGPGPDELHIGPDPMDDSGAKKPAPAAGEAKGGPKKGSEEAAELLRRAAKALAEKGSDDETRALVALARGSVEEAVKLLERKKDGSADPKRSALRAVALIHAGESAEAAKLLREAAARIESKGAVSLRNLSFAKRIWSYGLWEKNAGAFRAGQRVMVYCEVLGFACVKHSAEKYAVRVKIDLAVDRADGTPVVKSLRSDAVEHQTKSHIHDLHLCSRFDIPKNLSPGKYVLRAKVTDRSTGGSGTMAVPFEVAAGGKK